jgi:hypothetical protein
MATLTAPLAEELAATAHWSDEPPAALDEQEFDLLAFELWHLGNYPDFLELEEWDDRPDTVASRASCL